MTYGKKKKSFDSSLNWGGKSLKKSVIAGEKIEGIYHLATKKNSIKDGNTEIV